MSGALLAASGPFARVNIDAISVSETDTSPVEAGFRFNPDGTIDENRNGLYVSTGQWWTKSPQTGVGANYEVRAQSAGATGTWTNAAEVDDTWIGLGSTREWRVVAVGASTNNSASRVYEIRAASGGSALDSESLSASATTV